MRAGAAVTRRGPAQAIGATLALLVLAGCGGAGKSSSSDTSARSSATTSGQGSQSSQPASSAQGATTPAAPAAPAAPAGASPAASGSAQTVGATSGAVTATLHVAGSHRPRVGRAWPIRFTVTSAGRPVRASVDYEYMFAGQVVAHRSHYTFIGRFSDVFRWPSSAVGYPLTFRAVIRAQGRTVNLDYPVQVSR
jgi:hypothetical protein